MISQALRTYLFQQGVPIRERHHATAATAAEAAHAQHVSEHLVVKVVVVVVDRLPVLAAVPADRNVNLDALRIACGGADAALMSEADCMELFPGCEMGAITPFCESRSVPLWADVALRDNDRLYINAGAHDELLKLSPDEFNRAFEPFYAPIAAPRTPHMAGSRQVDDEDHDWI